MLVSFFRTTVPGIVSLMSKCPVDVQFREGQWEQCMALLSPGDKLYLAMGSDLGDSFLEAGRLLRQLQIRGVDVVFVKSRRTFRSCDLSPECFSQERLEAVAHFVQVYIQEHQKKGRAKAKRLGRLGRPKLTQPEHFAEAYRAFRRHDLNLSAAAEACGMSCTTFWRRAREIH